MRGGGLQARELIANDDSLSDIREMLAAGETKKQVLKVGSQKGMRAGGWGVGREAIVVTIQNNAMRFFWHVEGA